MVEDVSFSHSEVQVLALVKKIVQLWIFLYFFATKHCQRTLLN